MPDTIPLKVIQNCEFDILKYIKSVCDQNGLKYFLAYGTLIGAVRHQGFIPWDDDMDIHMPREDYMRFVEIVQHNPHPYYKLISKETSPIYNYIWAKLIDSRTELIQISPIKQRVPLGLFVDIFILDGAGDTIEEAEKAYDHAYSVYRHRIKVAATVKMGAPVLIQKESIIQTAFKWSKHILKRLTGARYWMNLHEKICLQRAYHDSEYVSAFGAGTYPPSRNVWKRDSFGEGTDVIFNGEIFRAPCNWDEVLRPEYGDYMTLPPPEKRQSKHTYEIHMNQSLIEKYSS